LRAEPQLGVSSSSQTHCFTWYQIRSRYVFRCPYFRRRRAGSRRRRSSAGLCSLLAVPRITASCASRLVARPVSRGCASAARSDRLLLVRSCRRRRGEGRSAAAGLRWWSHCFDRCGRASAIWWLRTATLRWFCAAAPRCLCAAALRRLLWRSDCTDLRCPACVGSRRPCAVLRRSSALSFGLVGATIRCPALVVLRCSASTDLRHRPASVRLRGPVRCSPRRVSTAADELLPSTADGPG
jgi:hypothetical protein